MVWSWLTGGVYTRLFRSLFAYPRYPPQISQRASSECLDTRRLDVSTRSAFSVFRILRDVDSVGDRTLQTTRTPHSTSTWKTVGNSSPEKRWRGGSPRLLRYVRVMNGPIIIEPLVARASTPNS
eukprot:1182023-Prorocentrum_minimum.AAC.4